MLALMVLLNNLALEGLFSVHLKRLEVVHGMRVSTRRYHCWFIISCSLGGSHHAVGISLLENGARCQLFVLAEHHLFALDEIAFFVSTLCLILFERITWAPLIQIFLHFAWSGWLMKIIFAHASTGILLRHQNIWRRGFMSGTNCIPCDSAASRRSWLLVTFVIIHVRDASFHMFKHSAVDGGTWRILVAERVFGASCVPLDEVYHPRQKD